MDCSNTFLYTTAAVPESPSEYEKGAGRSHGHAKDGRLPTWTISQASRPSSSAANMRGSGGEASSEEPSEAAGLAGAPPLVRNTAISTPCCACIDGAVLTQLSARLQDA